MNIENIKDMYQYFKSIGIKNYSDFDSRYSELESICRDNGFRVGSTMDEIERLFKSENEVPIAVSVKTETKTLSFKRVVSPAVTWYLSIEKNVAKISRGTNAKIEKILTGIMVSDTEILVTWADIHYNKGQTIEFDGLTLTVAENYKSDNSALGRGIVFSTPIEDKDSPWGLGGS